MSNFAEERERYEYADHSWSLDDWWEMQRFLRERVEQDVPAGAMRRVSAREGYDAAGRSTIWHCIKWRMAATDHWQYTAGFNNSTQCPPFNC